ncbi:hypothetical protein PQX77_011203 [Marasmius sp. AFHP31]|nr:hypothetical protein PQX77_011203 [Marasmius sp. AFHP31]
MPSQQLSQDDIDKIQPVLRSPDEEAALMLEDIALGNRMNRRRAASQLEPNSNLGRAHSFSMETVITPPILAEQGMYPFSKPSSPSSRNLPSCGLPQEHPLALLVDPSTNVVHQIVSILPDEPTSRNLVQLYFERIEWYTKIFHYPSFMSEANHLLDQISLFSSDATTWDKSSSPPRISFPFLSTYFMVLCLAYHLSESPVSQTPNINDQDAAVKAKKFYNAAQVCLWIDNFTANHSLESVQSLILMGIYQQNLDDSDSHWALLGSGIKIAQNLGLARLGSESDGKNYAGPWKSIVRREVARRVWWNLVYGDWSHAASHNGVYAVHPSQNGTGYPANINDVDLVDGQPLKQVPSSQYTEMTYSLTRFRFVEIYRQIVDNMENPTGYGFIVDTDARLRDMLEVELPASFQVQEGSPKEAAAHSLRGVKRMEYNIALIMGETRRMRLHRPFLFRGYKDRKYSKSKEQCIASARAVLEILKSDPEQAGHLLKWYMIMFHGFAAAVVLFIDYCHLRADDPAALELRKKELHDALSLFKNAQLLSGVSQNAINLLEGMMNTAEQRFSPSSRKRSAPDDHERWDRVAKKTIVSANRQVGLTRSPQIPGSIPTPIPMKFGSQSPDLKGGEPVLSPGRPFPSPTSTSSRMSSSQPPSFHPTLSPHPIHSPHPGSVIAQQANVSVWATSHSHSGSGREVIEHGMFTSKDWNFLDSTAMKAFDDVTISELGQLLWSGDDSYPPSSFEGGLTHESSSWGPILGQSSL